MNPKVSVCITTYNHEKFISKALDSVLMQETNFEFEILIGEDDSSDNTREIVKEYAELFPDVIRLFLNNRDDVIYIKGRPTGRYNFINNIRHAKGKYIAILDGDDCWTDPNKLQVQVDFLDANDDFAICAHNVNVRYMHGNIKPHPFYTHMPSGPFMCKKPERITTIADLIDSNYLQTPSVIFRAGLFDSFPDWYCTLDRGDWPLHILNAEHGNIIYIDKIMATYHVHNDGIYSSLSLAEQLKGAVNVAITLDKHLSYKYHNIVFKKNTQRFLALILLYCNSRRYFEAIHYFFKYIKTYRTEGSVALLKLVFNRIFSTANLN